jgi:arylsulfatase
MGFAWAVPLAILIGIAGCSSAPGERPVERPNVILLLIDALRADHLGAYGYERDTSPNLDALAERGVRFTSAVSPSSATRVSMASLWTGAFPSRHQVASRVKALPERFVTAAELAKQAGYRTAAFCPNPNLDRSYGHAQGWDVYVDRALRPRRGWGPAWWRFETAKRIHELALRFLDMDPDSPFLLWLHYRDVHGPYVPPPDYLGHFRSDTRRPLGPEERERRHRYLTLADDRNDLRHYIDRYDDEIRYTDDQIGEFLAALESRGLLEDTFVIVASDHGEEFLDHGGWNHGETLFEEMLHVPLIIVGPGLEARIEERPVSTLSLYATIAGWIGAEAPAHDGVDLGALLRGESIDLPAPVYAERVRWQGEPQRVVRAGRWKAILDRPDEPIRLFDLERDPGEVRDQAGEEVSVRDRMQSHFGDFARDVLRDAAAPEAAGAVDEDLRQRLEALGYTDEPGG